MPCRRPFSSGPQQFGCGQCMPCRLARRRLWVTRQRLEATAHGDSSFITLTYDNPHLPDGLQLQPSDLRDWLKRFRARISPLLVRFYAVGEYGEKSDRPHYHLSVFGVSGATVQSGSRFVHYGFANDVQATWKLGQIFAAPFSDLTARYVAGYTTKKMTNKDDSRLMGRHPEFGRMSNRPGLGVPAILKLASTLTEGGLGFQMKGNLRDVPTVLSVGREKLYLGRYLTHQLRTAVGMSDEEIQAVKQHTSFEQQHEMLALLQDKISVGPLTPITAKQIYKEVNLQKIRQIETRYQIWSKKRGSL